MCGWLRRLQRQIRARSLVRVAGGMGIRNELLAQLQVIRDRLTEVAPGYDGPAGRTFAEIDRMEKLASEHAVFLTDGQLDLLTELLRNYREGVESGDISGYGQSREEEISDVD